MKRLVGILLLLLTLPLCRLGAGPVRGRAVKRPLHLAWNRPAVKPNQWVVRFAPSTGRLARSRLHARAGARVVSTIPQLGVETLELPSVRALQLYSRSSGVLWREPNRMRYPLLAPPNDPAYNLKDTDLSPDNPTWFKWDAHRIQCAEGWSLWPGRYFDTTDKGSAAVRMAVIDTGIDYDHPDFRNGASTSSDSRSGGQLNRSLDRSIINGQAVPDAWDVFGHGTHVTGIAAAATNNGAGVTGNGYNATVMSLRVIDETGNGTESDIAQAIVYAADHGALVCNISLGGYGYSQVEEDAVEYAWNKGTLVVAAAGNDGNETPNYPGALARVLAVSATSEQDTLAFYSNFGEFVGISAPGGDIDFERLTFLGVYSTMPTYFVPLNDPEVFGASMNYDYLLGTSMASPQVAGLAALYAGSRGYTQSTPGAPLQIWQALQRGCDNINRGDGGWDPFFGYGRINAFNTLNLDAVPNPRNAVNGGMVGQVRFQGMPAAGATIEAAPADGGAALSAQSRDDGAYRLTDLPAGLYTLTATTPQGSATVANVEVIAGCDTPAVDFDIGDALPPPAAPTDLQATAVSSTRIDLSWTSNSSNEAGFKIERMQPGSSFSQIAAVEAGVTSYSDTGLSPSTTYTYQVRAYNRGGSSDYSNKASATTPVGLAAFSLASSSIRGGRTTAGTVTLSGPAPAGGIVVSLTSSDPRTARVPAGVTVRAGASTAKFVVRTRHLRETATVGIGASYDGVTKTVELTVHQ